jgi:beta-catenin-like protein 1
MEIATARSHNPKRKRDATSPPPPYSNGETTTEEIDLSLLDAIEKSQSLSKSQPIETLDPKTLKKLILSFERKYKENIESRLKYPDQPEKFADSEIDLHNELHKLKILSSAPELYPDLINLNTIPSVLSLLSHENTDIAIDVIQLLQDLTDEDVVEMSNENEEESMKALVNTLIENNVLELLVQNLQRLSDSDDQDEMAAVYNTLATVENMIEVEPKVAEMICEKTRVLKWLLGKLKVREFDSNKQYAAEILSILLQNSEANQKKLGQMNGVDVVLQAVAMYKSKDPKSGDEEEMVENLFDCLCCLLMPLENKERFVKAEGVELMIIIIKQKKLAYGSAIRALDFAMTNYPPACERFVDVLGLKTAFAAFMGKASYFLLFPDLVFPIGLVTFIG